MEKRRKKRRKKWCPHPNFAQEDKKKLLTMEFDINWKFSILIKPWQFQHKWYSFRNVWNIQLFVYLQRSKLCEGKYWISPNYIFPKKNSKIINYSTNICWSCQDTIVAHYVFTTTSIHDGRLFICFVLYLWDPRKADASNHVPGDFGRLSKSRGAWAWCAKVIEYWMISSLKIKLTHSWKFWGTGKCLWCCWKDLDEQDLMEFIW